jgi:hypothetical protein
MPDYTWVCHSCKETNIPGTQVCQACGFPAEASAYEIDEAVTGIKRQPRKSRKEWLEKRREEIAALPLPKKVLAYVLRAIQIFGALLFWSGVIELSMLAVVFGFTMVVIAEILFQCMKGNFSKTGA